MDRLYQPVIEELLRGHHEMVFLMGPRQVGKTTTSRDLMKDWGKAFYFNWDDYDDRQLIIDGPAHVAEKTGLLEAADEPILLVFDEIHKFHDWKLFLKGLYDAHSQRCRIVVTGSARLDVYKKGGDSLMGRYFPYHFHPLSVGEIVRPQVCAKEICLPIEIDDESFEALVRLGGYPAPFLSRDQKFSNRWRRLRLQQIVQEDIRDLTRIHELSQLERVMQLLAMQSGQLLNYSSLAQKVGVDSKTIKAWVEVFKSLYYCYTLTPWSKNTGRSLLKTPKCYLWDWAMCADEGAIVENFIASHLLKAVHFWTDHGYGQYGLYYLRDKQQREVDFLVTKNDQPWFLVEAKRSNNKSISKSLHHFQELTGAPHAFQVVLNLDYVDVDCFSYTKPIIVPAKTFLSQLL